MKVSRYKGKVARTILAALVMNDEFCQVVASKRQKRIPLFNQDWTVMVSGWCFDYLDAYGEAPKEHIATLYEEWAESREADPALVRNVDRFLSYVSEEYEDLPMDRLVDLAKSYFREVRVRKAINDAGDYMANGQVEFAEAKIAELVQQPGMEHEGNGELDIFNFQKWTSTFADEEEKPVFTYSGPLGQFIGSSFQKGEFYADKQAVGL